MRRNLFFGLFLIVVLTQASNAQNSSSVQTFRVGVIQSLTGVAAEDGKNTVQSLQLATEQINKKGNIKIELFVEDDQSSAKDAVSAYMKLAGAKADAIIGATWSFTTSAIIPLARTHSLVTLNTSSLPEAFSLEQGGGYAFCNGMSVWEEDEPFRKFLRIFKPKTVVVVSTATGWGEIHRRTIVAIAEQEDVKVVEDLQASNVVEGEWLNAVTRIKTKQPEAVALMLNKEDISNFIRRSREQNFNPLFFASKNTFDAFRFMEKKESLEGLCFTYTYHRLYGVGNFATDYRTRFKEDPRIYADNSYDALFLLHNAFSEAKNKGIPLREALVRSTYRGLAGDYHYDSKTSFATGHSSLVCIKDKNFIVR